MRYIYTYNRSLVGKRDMSFVLDVREGKLEVECSCSHQSMFMLNERCGTRIDSD